MAYILQPQKFTTLMIIGKTGNGKSACGNTILGQNAFTSNASSTSVTKLIGQGVAQLGSRVIQVIDTPGFEDTQFNEDEGLKLVSSQCEKVLLLCPDGINACLIVLRYGSRFTKEEKNTIKHIREIFGETFLKKFCIVVMSYGDIFFHDHQENLTFEQWVENQSGDFKDLYEECGGKIILFDNRSKQRDNQIQELFNIVDSVDEIYTDKHFEEAKKTRYAMLVSAKLPKIRDRTLAEVSLIFQELNKIFQLQTNDVKDDELQTLKVRAEDLLKENVEQDNDTGVLNQMIEHVKSLLANIEAETRLSDEMKMQKRALKYSRYNMVTFLRESEMDKKRLFAEIEKQHREIMEVTRELLKIQLDRRCIVM